MTLKDILAIDTCPFDEDVLNECIKGEFNIPYAIRSALCNLILHYLNLFWEKYQPDLIRTYAPDRLVGAGEEDEDDYFIWTSEAESILHTAVTVNGWQCICLQHNPGDIELSDVVENGDDSEAARFHEAYMRYLDACDVEGFARTFFNNEEALMKDVAYYMEDAVIGILWNEKLSAYTALKKKNAAMIQEVCKEEDFYISRLEHDIWMPFWVCFVEEKKEYKEEEYGVFLLGCDGYNYYYFDCFDPNWVCKTFVMDQLLDLALKKLEAYIAAKKLVA